MPSPGRMLTTDCTSGIKGRYGMDSMNRVTAIVTCMGRLRHLQETLPVLLQGGSNVCVVDYSCPDNCGTWVEENYADEHVWVERVEGKEVFNKPEALNVGARSAVDRNPDTFLLFVDADTVTTPALWGWLSAALGADDCAKHFYYVQSSEHGKDSTGVLFVQGKAFLKSGGYDERHIGWGAEDLDMRLRLFFKEELGYAEMPFQVVRSIGHDDPTRVEHYEEKDKMASHKQNMLILAKNVEEWTGGMSIHNAAAAIQLLGVRMIWPGQGL